MATTLATWTIDPVHSSVEFSLDYMGFTTYRTGFRALEGSLQFDAAQPAASSVTASIPVASVDVTNDRLMSRLMDLDLLGGKEHPTVTFKSTRVEALDPARWKVTGDLTMHGVTRPVVLDTRYLGQAKHPFSGKISAAFRALTKKPFVVDAKRLTKDAGRVIRSDHGKPRIADGPYSETKEILGGYYTIEGANYDEAVKRSLDHPHIEYGGTIEVRQVWEM